MSYFKAKMHQIRFRMGLRPRPRWRSLQRSPRPHLRGLLLSVIMEGRGRGGKGEEGRTREGRGRGRKGEGEGGKEKGERERRDRGKGEGGEGEWGSPTHYFRLKSCTFLHRNSKRLLRKQQIFGGYFLPHVV